METKMSSGSHIDRIGISPTTKNAQQHCPSGRLHRDGHESGHAGGRAFVSVRRPLMKRNGRYFEEESQ